MVSNSPQTRTKIQNKLKYIFSPRIIVKGVQAKICTQYTLGIKIFKNKLKQKMIKANRLYMKGAT